MQYLRDNGLTIALMAMFILSLTGMVGTGWLSHNQELSQHGLPGISLIVYLASGAFISALFENWESEFLQMAVYVVLTAYLYQRGSAESLDPDDPQRADDLMPIERWPLGSVRRWFKAHGLGVALGLLFVVSFALHLWGSLHAANEEAVAHGGEPENLFDYLADAHFWFESFQNWQSEFLSTAVLVVLSIFLRYQGSPESKPVMAPDSQMGE